MYVLHRAPWLRGRVSDPRLRDPGFESCDKTLGKFVHSILLQSTQLYAWVPGYRQWLICVRAAFVHWLLDASQRGCDGV